MLTWQTLIHDCRKNLQAGRDSGQLPTLTRPHWIKDDDLLNRTYDEAPRLLSEGEVVWGYLVQANQLLYDAGHVDMPAFVVFAKDRSLDAEINEVEDLRAVMFQQRSSPLNHAEAREFGAMLNREQDRNFWLEVPACLAGGRKLYGSALMIVRSWLPRGALVSLPIPLLIERHGGGQVLPLPVQFWPREFADVWRANITAVEEPPRHIPVGGLSWLTPISVCGGIPLVAAWIKYTGLDVGGVDVVSLRWAAAAVCIGLFLIIVSVVRGSAGNQPPRVLRNAYNDEPTVLETTDSWMVSMRLVGIVSLVLGGIIGGLMMQGGMK